MPFIQLCRPGDLWMRETKDGGYSGNDYELMMEFARAVPGGITLKFDKPKSFNGMMQRVGN
jgi:hypothetical protein